MPVWRERTNGSSPLTRGKPTGSEVWGGTERLIPAHAGKTPPDLTRSISRQAHPRSRGENISEHANSDPAHGSSPLTRGKRVSLPLPLEAFGLIPAHAGKTTRPTRRPSRQEAHPRSRGENRLVYWPTREVMGSSPLTRGKHQDLPLLVAAGRLIPAHAGKTKKVPKSGQASEAHPRSRGEN